MPFIVPVYLCLKAAKNMQFSKSVMRINYLNVSDYVGWNWRCGGTTPTKTYKVVVVSDSGNKYRFRNSSDSATFPQSGVTLNLQELGTYVFDYSDSSAQGHPFRFSTTS